MIGIFGDFWGIFINVLTSFGFICMLSKFYLADRALILKTKIFDIFFIGLILAVPVEILSFIGFAIMMLSVILFFSIMDIQIKMNEKGYKAWWNYIETFEKYVLFFIISYLGITIYAYGKNANYSVILYIFTFLIFGIFLLCLRNKFVHSKYDFFKNKIVFILQSIIGNLFWGIYQIIAALFLLSGFFSSFLYAIDPKGVDDDRCIDIGICPEGFTFDKCDSSGNSCTITKKYCLENGYIWYEDTKFCNIRKKITSSKNF